MLERSARQEQDGIGLRVYNPTKPANPRTQPIQFNILLAASQCGLSSATKLSPHGFPRSRHCIGCSQYPRFWSSVKICFCFVILTAVVELDGSFAASFWKAVSLCFFDNINVRIYCARVCVSKLTILSSGLDRSQRSHVLSITVVQLTTNTAQYVPDEVSNQSRFTFTG